MTVFSLSATDTVEKERGNQCKHYINPITKCQAPPWKYIVPLAYSEVSYGSRELSALSRVSSYWKEKKYRKKKWHGKVWKYIQKYTADKHMAILMSIPYIGRDTVISLLCGLLAASSLNFSPALIRGGLSSKLSKRYEMCAGPFISAGRYFPHYKGKV